MLLCLKRASIKVPKPVLFIILRAAGHKYCYTYDFVKHKDPEHILKKACLCGNMQLVKTAIEKGAKEFDISLNKACKGGHTDLAELMIEKGATDFNLRLKGACTNNQLEMVKMMVAAGATEIISALRYAREYYYPEIIEFLEKCL